jgi:hypothetical protein
MRRKRKMKHIIILVLVVLVGVMTGCGTSQIEQGVPLTGFSKVEISNGFHVDITVGEDYSVVLKVGEDILDEVEAIKEGDTLKIRPKPLHDFGRGVSLEAEVTMPALTSLTLQNGSHVTVRGSGDDVDFNISGGSHANLGDFSVENAVLSAIGGSHVTINVSGKLDVEVKGGSHVRYIGEPQIGDIDISSGSTFSEK